MASEAEAQFAFLVKKYYDGAWEWNSAWFNEGQQFMSDAVELLEIEYNVKVDKKEVE